MTLVEILKKNKWDCDKDPHCANKQYPGHTYLEVYDQLFFPFKNENVEILEIGILRGTSMKLWHEYFENGGIHGIDTFERNWKGCSFEEVKDSLIDYKRTEIYKVNSCSEHLNEKLSRESFLNSVPDNYFHVIIDDGSHELIDQINTFNNFKDKLHRDGIYIVEDIGWTDGKPFNPNEILKYIPQLKLMDMRYPNKHDNAIAIYYNEDSQYFNNYQSYYDNEHWKSSWQFSYEYILQKQRETT